MDYSFLNDRFKFDEENEVFISINTRLGLSTGDDSKLYLSIDEYSTLIWWKENRGREFTIFEGEPLISRTNLELLFVLLGLPKTLKWDVEEPITIPYLKSEQGHQMERFEKLGINTTGQMFEQMVTSAIIMLETQELIESFKYKKT